MAAFRLAAGPWHDGHNYAVAHPPKGQPKNCSTSSGRDDRLSSTRHFSIPDWRTIPNAELHVFLTPDPGVR